MEKKHLFIVGVLLIIAVGSGFVFVQTKSDGAAVLRGCTMEEKICPDGSSVGRTGPKCEFSNCPSPIPPTTTSVGTSSVRKVNEITYVIKDGKLVSYFSQESSLYDFPSDLIKQLGIKSVGWGNGNAAPIEGSSDKYYLGVSSVGKSETCEFSNKIYILDTHTGTAKLFYEENNKTLTKDDPRACNKEMQLLGSEGNKLVISYHTLETGGVCDNIWGFPDTTWYLNTAAPTEGTKKYEIPTDLYERAQREMKKCQEGL